MFAVGVRDHVMIAHSFADPFFGPATRMHGATYTVEVEVRAARLGPHHVVMDIGALRQALRDVLGELDYGNLDEHPAFPDRTSTTERVAEYVARRLSARLRDLPAEVAPPAGGSLRVTLHESPVAWAAFEQAL